MVFFLKELQRGSPGEPRLRNTPQGSKSASVTTSFSSRVGTILSSNNFRDREPLSANMTDSGTFSRNLLELKIMQTMVEKEVVTDALFYP